MISGSIARRQVSNLVIEYAGSKSRRGKQWREEKLRILLSAVILLFIMTSVFDKLDEREGEIDETATEVTDDAAEYCKW